MKKLIYSLLFLLVCSNVFSQQTIKFSQFPTYIGNPNGSWVPIVVGGANRKVDASYFGYTKIDSLSISIDTLWAYKNGAKSFYKLLPLGSGGPTSWGFINGNILDQTDLITQLNLKAPLSNPTFTGVVSGITKAMVGLSNVDNTPDASKPISSAVAAALNLKQDILISGTTLKTINNSSLLGSGNIDISANPAGATTQIQYNNAGSFGATADFTWNNSTKDLTVIGNIRTAGSGRFYAGNIDSLSYIPGGFVTRQSDGKFVITKDPTSIIPNLSIRNPNSGDTLFRWINDSTAIVKSLQFGFGVKKWTTTDSTLGIFSDTLQMVSVASRKKLADSLGAIIAGGGVAFSGITGQPTDNANLSSALNLKANLASPTFTGTVGGITKGMVGLGNVDNTTDLGKPISTATQTALDAKQATLVSGTNIKTINSISLVGSGNIDLGSTGEANTTSNSGAGLGLAQAKSGVDLPFKSLTFPGPIKGTSNTNDVALNWTPDATVDNNSQAFINAITTTNAQTGTTYTLVAADNGKVITFNNASAITVTYGSSLPTGFNCTIVQIGAGQVTISVSGVTLRNRQSHTKLAGQYAMATLLEYVANEVAFQGDTAL